MQFSTCPKCQHERQPNDTAPATECPRCGLIFAKYLAAQAAKNDRAKARPPAVPPPPPTGPTLGDRVSAARDNYREANSTRHSAETLATAQICKACGTLNWAGAKPGSGAIELVLWLFLLWPIALIYSIWRRMNRRRACSACGSRELVGVGSPVGRDLVAKHLPGGLPPPPPPELLVGSRVFYWVLAIFGLPFLLLGAFAVFGR